MLRDIPSLQPKVFLVPAEHAEKIGKIGNCSKAEVVSPPFVLLLRKGGKSMPVKASPRGGNSRPA